MGTVRQASGDITSSRFFAFIGLHHQAQVAIFKRPRMRDEDWHACYRMKFFESKRGSVVQPFNGPGQGRQQLHAERQRRLENQSAKLAIGIGHKGHKRTLMIVIVLQNGLHL